ncbi:histidine kinase [Pseudokineococcus basanitobsidens]|uniref:histidine kinase n=1 Tax=Pseudokineococcus basanitobsidens TaxID=1926649 RepID=A0ABU8RJR1_9ACTN
MDGVDGRGGRYEGLAPARRERARPGPRSSQRVDPQPVGPRRVRPRRVDRDGRRRPPEPEAAFDRTAAWLRAHPFAVDATAAGALLLLLVLLVAGQVSAGPVPLVVQQVLLVVPLAWRRVAPRLTFVLVVAAGLVVLVGGDLFNPGLVAVLVTVHAVTARGTRRDGRLVLAVGLAAAVAAGMRFLGGLPVGGSSAGSQPAGLFAAAAMALLVLAAWSVGQLSRTRVSHEAALAERARLLEAERDQQAVIAASAERARIAREMHDVVAHSLSVVVAQADGGRYAARVDPAAAVTALETIAGTGRQALADMRGLLGVLRHDEGARRTPQPGSGDLGDLVEAVRDGGLDVVLDEQGERRPLPPSPGLAVYRITQEALTNVLKHAGPRARAQVRLRWLDGVVEVEVLDDGRGAGAPPGPPGGQGLVGMRERAALVGGRVDAGPARGGGWRVRALLPDDAPPVAPPATTAPEVAR